MPEQYLTQIPRFKHNNSPPHIQPDPFVKTGTSPTTEIAGAPVETLRVGPNTTLPSLGTISWQTTTR